METIYVIIGNKKETNLFYVNKKHTKLIKLENIKNPDAGLREKDLVSDSAGKVLKGNGLGKRKLGTKHAALAHSLEMYVGRILETVVNITRKKRNPKILLVSEPGFLGLVKKHFTSANKKITKTIPKELINLSNKNIFSKLRNEIKYI